MSPALALALAIIVVGGFLILSRLRLLVMALSFWLVFVAAVAVVAATGHAMTARWHLGPVDGLHLWTVLAFSPEILVFLFFMLTDPKTVPAGRRARVSLPSRSRCSRRSSSRSRRRSSGPRSGCSRRSSSSAPLGPRSRRSRRRSGPRRGGSPRSSAAVLVAYAGVLVAAGLQTQPASATPRRVSQVARLPQVAIRPSRGVDSNLDRTMAADRQDSLPTCSGDGAHSSVAPDHALAAGGNGPVPHDHGEARGQVARPDGRGGVRRRAATRIARVRREESSAG